jgi:predicted DNA binding CopG/RHH family protein
MKKNKKIKSKEIHDYDSTDVSTFVDANKPLKFNDIGLKLPELSPTQVVSIRLPTELLNELRAMGSQQDVPYQALIKLMLAESIKKFKKRSA